MRVIVLLALGIVVLRLCEMTPLAHHGIEAAQHQGSVSGIIVGLMLCAPFVGLFVLLRAFRRWHRGFHQRMATQGVFNRDGTRR